MMFTNPDLCTIYFYVFIDLLFYCPVELTIVLSSFIGDFLYGLFLYEGFKNLRKDNQLIS